MDFVMRMWTQIQKHWKVVTAIVIGWVSLLWLIRLRMGNPGSGWSARAIKDLERERIEAARAEAYLEIEAAREADWETRDRINAAYAESNPVLRRRGLIALSKRLKGGE